MLLLLLLLLVVVEVAVTGDSDHSIKQSKAKIRVGKLRFGIKHDLTSEEENACHINKCTNTFEYK